MITKFGKRFLTNYLAGNVGFSAKELAFGIGDLSPSLGADGTASNDTKLQFEFYRAPVTLSSIEISLADPSVAESPTNKYIYKAVFSATMPQDVSGVISEIALYPASRGSANNFESKFISSFENNVLWYDSSGFNPGLQLNDSTYTSKIGLNSVVITTPASTSIEYKTNLGSFDLTGYSVKDSLSIAYKKIDTNLSNIRVKFYSSSTEYCYIDFTPEAGTGDKIQSVELSSLFSNTTATPPNFTNITNVAIEVTADDGGITEVHLDGLRINDEDTFDPIYGMISRSVLTGADIITKTSGRQVEVEYKLQLGF
jgi:hypothetical protein